MARELYVCRGCGRGFERPAMDHCLFPHAFGWGRDSAAVCPHCGSGDFTVAADCGNPGCAGLRFAQEPLCPGCRLTLRRRLCGFLTALSPAELEQTDRWLEGTCPTALLGELGGGGAHETL